jgi:hypothetical protein
MGKIKHVDDVLSSVFQRTGVMGKSVRNTGSGHFVFEFAGYQHIIGKTPSDWRSEKNTVADICRGVALRSRDDRRATGPEGGETRKSS